MTAAERLKDAVKPAKKPSPVLTADDFLSTGSTLGNLGCSGRIDGGFMRGHIVLLVGDSRSGKAQPLDAKILTPNGWKKMGRLVVGDTVVDPDGGIGRVEAIYPKGLREVFSVKFSDGSATECCDEHLWLTATSVERQQDRRAGRELTGSVKSLAEIRETIVSPWNTDRERANHQIPMTHPVEFFKRELPIAPYLMGVLLGNGHFRTKGVSLSSGESQIVEKVKKLLPASCQLTQRAGPDHEICSLRRGLPNEMIRTVKKVGLCGCLAKDKFIPRDYLRSSTDDRIALLNGLMDTDGYAKKGKGGSIEYCTVSPDLARGFSDLVRSLGGTVTMTLKKTPKYTYRGDQRTGQRAYNLRPSLPYDILPFTLDRKADRYLPRVRFKPIRQIVAVEAAGRKLCQCILVSTKRNLYVTDDYIVTHNTWLSMQAMAEASINPVFKEYRLIHDNPERGALMDVRKYFGEKLFKRLEPPSTRGHSSTSEEFYANVAAAAKVGVPFIYVLDSEDALQSEAEIKKTAKVRSARKKGDSKVAGSYGVDKAKINSAGMREAHNSLGATRSILIIIKQTRQNINPLTARIKPKTRSGGDALTFYNRQELWFSIREKIRKDVNGRQRPIGSLLRVKVEKNCVDGRERFVDLPFYPSVGFDEVGGLVRFLLDEGHWKEGKGGIIDAAEFGEAMKEEALVQYIEDNSLEPELQHLVGKVWADIEAACSVTRKPRYS